MTLPARRHLTQFVGVVAMRVLFDQHAVLLPVPFG